MEYKSGWMNGPFVVINVVTTGHSLDRDRIIEFSAVQIAEGKVVDATSCLVHPGIALLDTLVEHIGIAAEDLVTEQSFQEEARWLLNYISDGYPVVVGEQVAHSVQFLQAEFDRCAIAWEEPPMLDIMTLVRYVFPDLKRLDRDILCRRLGIAWRAPKYTIVAAWLAADVLVELLCRVDAMHPDGVSLGGLRMLTVISDVLGVLREKGHDLSMEGIKTDDPAVYAMIAEGEVEGIYPLEGEDMRAYIQATKPCCMGEIVTAITLNRPGLARCFNEKDATSRIIYHQQIERTLCDVAGFSVEESDAARRDMAKKKDASIAKWRERFIKGYSQDDKENAARIFDELTSSAAFTVDREKMRETALNAMRLAWLKCHYPVEIKNAVERCGIRP